MYYIGISRTFGTIGILSDDEDFEPKFLQVPISKSRGVCRLNYRAFREMMQPYAAQEINEVQSMVIAKAVLETPNINPKHFKSSISSTRFYEAEKAILDYLGISSEAVEPRQWEHQLFTGKYKKLTKRVASIEYGNDNWPQFKQNKAEDRDGLCLAYWLKENFRHKPK